VKHASAGSSRGSKARSLPSTTPSVSRSRSPDNGKHRVGPEAVKGMVCESKLGRRPTLDCFGYPVSSIHEASETLRLRHNLLPSPVMRHQALFDHANSGGVHHAPENKDLILREESLSRNGRGDSPDGDGVDGRVRAHSALAHSA